MGPLKSLLSARDMRMDMQGSLGKLALDIKGVIGSLDPLDGADLTIKVEHPELDTMLAEAGRAGDRHRSGANRRATEGCRRAHAARLQCEGRRSQASANGTLKALSLGAICVTIDTGSRRLLKRSNYRHRPGRCESTLESKMSARRQLDFKAKLGDLAPAARSLKTRACGSDIKFKAIAADAARLASVFEVKDVPAAPLTVTGHILHSRKEIKFEALTAPLRALRCALMAARG